MLKELTHIADVKIHLSSEPEVYVVYDRNVAWVVKDFPWKALPIETSESRKTLETVEGICRWLVEQNASRSALILAVGGGITTDMAGFAASIYKRGIRYANLPTTLLSQVDAAIGGKTGVNLDGYKNMLGAFRMPEATFISADVLRTLPQRELRSGLAELLKTFLLADGKAYETALLHGVTQELILKAARIKEDIVGRDPFEKGERAKLNLGHTFGHAIEHASAGSIPHGEAVAMGIILAARLGESLGISTIGLSRGLKADFEAAGLPTDCPYPLETLKDAMAKDKKALGGGKVKFVIPVTPGEVVFHEMNPYDLHFDTK
ncbi:MAG: 3-dehydroquinate synthase [Bacteroidales bacterium]|nr:3-dehydroquinate synthase [Bacteroidales bacterium]